MAALSMWRLTLLAVLAGCGDERTLERCAPDVAPLPPSLSRPITYHDDVKSIVAQKCQRCHSADGVAGPPMDTEAEVTAAAPLIRDAVVSRTMPPFLADRCCQDYRDNFSLTEEEIAIVAAWVEQGSAAGVANDDPPPPPIGGLSRIDLVIEQPEPYTAAPQTGRTDDFRCYIIDFPIDETMFVTGMNPQPLNRSVVHHLQVGLLEGADLDAARALEAEDDLPGFYCEGGIGAVRVTRYIGGSMLGNDFPDGYGVVVNPDSALFLNVHYSVAHAGEDRTDQMAVEFKLDREAAPLSTIIIANPAWLLGDAMLIRANDREATYRVVLEPDLFTGNQDVDVWDINAHLHAYAKRVSVGILPAHQEDDNTCLLEIPRWQFGWEQPYWLQQPVRLGKDDKLELICTFDNSADHQPNIDGVPRASRDIAWGEGDQDMCAAFIGFSVPAP